MLFSVVPGQDKLDELKEALIQSVLVKRVAHAQCFQGASGSAVLPLALAFATYLNCMEPLRDDACGRCFSCTSMEKLIHPDLQLVFPNKSSIQEGQETYKSLFRSSLRESSFLTLEEWASVIGSENKQCQITRQDIVISIQNISLKTAIGKYKVVLIWLPEYLNHVAANTLLKTLEEPPLGTIFLLVSHNLEKVLPTIRSRVQQYNIPPFTSTAICKLLQSKFPNENPLKIKEVALFSQGDYHKAIQFMEKATEPHFDQFCDWMRSCYSQNFIQIIKQAELFQKQEKDSQKAFFVYALQLIRLILLNKFLEKKTFSQQISTFIEKFKQVITVEQIKHIIVLFDQGYNNLEQNANAKMVYTYISIQIVNLFQNKYTGIKRIIGS